MPGVDIEKVNYVEAEKTLSELGHVAVAQVRRSFRLRVVAG